MLQYRIAGYCRISVDEELDRDNTSIENQKAIIREYTERNFPGSSLTFYEDRDRSGYTFEQRENYQKMRKLMVERRIDILIVKDFSRFSRRNSRGLVELEDLRDYGIRIISIGDGIDFPNDDDWLKIQFQFLINEMPVTDASKKVRAVIKRRQQDGKWICAAPYGYIVNRRQEFEIVPTEAEVVRLIYRLYQDGWGYKRIANHLTDEGIPTPRMAERQRAEADGREYKRTAKSAWAIPTIQGILENDFYIGTFRGGKYTRVKINGKERRCHEDEQYVFENHHQPIISYREFATVRELMKNRTTNHYRGQKKYDNTYSGFLECGDCGSPMFSMSRPDLKEAYTCGLYHRRGLKGCTSHHIHVAKLNEVLKIYLRKVMDNSASMLEQLNNDLLNEPNQLEEAERSETNLEEVLAQLQEELKATKRQRIRDIMRHPNQEEMLEETYGELEDDLARHIEGIQNQIALTTDRRNTIIQVNRAAKMAMDVFEDILKKDKLDKKDLSLIIDKIKVYEDHLEVQLKADIDSLLRTGTLPSQDDQTVRSSNSDCSVSVVQKATHQADRVFTVNLIREGDPLEIFTDKDGGVVFKKYSLMGDLQVVSVQICDTVSKTLNCPVMICDRDTVIAVAGAPRREFLERHISEGLEHIMEGRQLYQFRGTETQIPIIEDGPNSLSAAIAAPILTEGDVMGCVVLGSRETGAVMGEAEYKLAQTIAGFLGKHMES